MTPASVVVVVGETGTFALPDDVAALWLAAPRRRDGEPDRRYSASRAALARVRAFEVAACALQ